MSRNGSGVYNLPAGNPVVSNTTITTTWANSTLNDIASSLTGSVAADGQTPMTGALNMANNKIIAVTNPTNAQDAATKNYTDVAIAASIAGLGTMSTQNANAVAITGGSITGATLNASDLSSGTVPFARLPSGSVLQVINATYSTYTSSSSSTFADTGLTATITPKFTTSKILVIANVAGGAKFSSNTSLLLKLVKNSTLISNMEGNGGSNSTTTTNDFGSCSINYLDSPATTSATIYKVQFASSNNTSGVALNDYRTTNGDSVSSITLMEIAG
jgi:hypothetical protein